ncbi:DUF1330 domain-containing protein [Shewanella intestini]|uniref:DUF1330 domain-containing protein n=1 Tax=Shewanella intestini TaxID=2017544 RepID=A0ABS5I0E7_9GAMM|nr:MULTISPECIES: DUF1330 domain-containing protein [Shewanella]MBR9727500.1 DUF1330 domain-containing protein [Shewanella intestini]MRG35350.1 DUF1330 domain-containing protein [Shewanella sp. XMDDZSB0408]
MTKHYSVLEVTPTSSGWGADYIGPASKVMAKYGGRYLARTANHERLEGQADIPAMRIIIEWPSKQAALNFMSDPEYVPHLQARTKGSISHHALIEATDDIA